MRQSSGGICPRFSTLLRPLVGGLAWIFLGGPTLWAEDAPDAVPQSKAVAAKSGELPNMASPLAPREAAARTVPSFFTRAVTGQLRNRSLCYVCRHGDRPVVLVVMRKLGPELRPLLRNIDRLVDRHRADGLRSFGVLISDDPFQAVSTVQTFSFNHRVAMPLTIATGVVAEPGTLDIPTASDLTVILYRKRRIEARFDYAPNAFRFEDARAVIERVKQFTGEPTAP